MDTVSLLEVLEEVKPQKFLNCKYCWSRIVTRLTLTKACVPVCMVDCCCGIHKHGLSDNNLRALNGKLLFYHFDHINERKHARICNNLTLKAPHWIHFVKQAPLMSLFRQRALLKFSNERSWSLLFENERPWSLSNYFNNFTLQLTQSERQESCTVFYSLWSRSSLLSSPLLLAGSENKEVI